VHYNTKAIECKEVSHPICSAFPAALADVLRRDTRLDAIRGNRSARFAIDWLFLHRL
jgi:hypothetical protein